MKSNLYCDQCDRPVQMNWVIGSTDDDSYYVICCDGCENVVSSNNQWSCGQKWERKQYDKLRESYTVSSDELVEMFNDWKNNLTYEDFVEWQLNKRYGKIL